MTYWTDDLLTFTAGLLEIDKNINIGSKQSIVLGGFLSMSTIRTL